MSGNPRLSEVSSVYARAARDYYRAGWQPIPLPRAAKKSPPEGFTGDGARHVTHIDLKRWEENPVTAAGNIAVHLLHPFIGIDVDTRPPGPNGTIPKRGIETIRRAEAKLGPLPPTLISTARALPDPVTGRGSIPCTESGIRVYRLPDTDIPAGHLWPKTRPVMPRAEQALEPWGYDVEVAGKVRRLTGVDVISPAYRYMVVWPSTNPDADGAEYGWWLPMGDAASASDYVLLDSVPALGMISTLPRPWAELFTQPAPDPEQRARRARSKPTGAAKGGQPSQQDKPAPSVFDLELPPELAVADPLVQFWTVEDAQRIIDRALTDLEDTPHSRINIQLRDAAATIGHFVPAFLSPAEFRQELLAAQRYAWVVTSGMPDDRRYGDALITIDRTLPYLDGLRAQRDPEGWIAVRIDDEPDTTGQDDTEQVADEQDDTEQDDEETDVESPFASSRAATYGSAMTRPSPPVSSAAVGVASDNGTGGPVDLDALADLLSGDGLEALEGEDGAADPELERMTAVLLKHELAKRERGEDTPEGKAEARRRRHAEAEVAERAKRYEEIKEYERQRRQARRELDDEEAGQHRPPDPRKMEQLRSKIMRRADLDKVKSLVPLIDGWLWRKSLAQVFGPSGHYKTFVAADMAAAVCLGRDWFGWQVPQAGPVLYICAEGVQGFAKRVQAMELTRDRERLENLDVIGEPVQIGGPLWPELVALATETGYLMIIIDTQARSTSGKNENSSEMNPVIEDCDWLARESGACVLLIHHSGKGDSTDSRGFSGVKGALQSQIRVVRPKRSSTVEVKATKQKDHDELGPVFFELEPYALPGGERTLVISANKVTDGMSPDRRAQREDEAREVRRVLDRSDLDGLEARPQIVKILDVTYSGGSGATKAELRSSVREILAQAGLPEITRQNFDKQWTFLESHGHLLKQPGAARYVLSVEACLAHGIKFVRPAWVAEDEWDDQIRDGMIPPAVIPDADRERAFGAVGRPVGTSASGSASSDDDLSQDELDDLLADEFGLPGRDD